MDRVGSAWIAVVGTLSGVLLTAASSLVAAELVARRQKEASERQAVLAMDEKRRQEVRETFVDFLTCYSALRDRILVFNEGQGDFAVRKEGKFLIESFASAEAAAFKRATHMLMITAATRTADTAALVVARLWDAAEAAERRDVDSFMRELDSGWLVFRDLYHAMRAELGRTGDVTFPDRVDGYYSASYGPSA